MLVGIPGGLVGTHPQFIVPCISSEKKTRLFGERLSIRGWLRGWTIEPIELTSPWPRATVCIVLSVAVQEVEKNEKLSRNANRYPVFFAYAGLLLFCLFWRPCMCCVACLCLLFDFMPLSTIGQKKYDSFHHRIKQSNQKRQGI